MTAEPRPRGRAAQKIYTREAIKTLDRLETFFQGGIRWAKGSWQNGERRCLVAALVHLCQDDRTSIRYVTACLKLTTPGGKRDLIWYSDHCDTFQEILDLIHNARKIAGEKIDSEVPNPAPRVPTPVDIGLPLAILPYITPEHLARLRMMAPGVAASLRKYQMQVVANQEAA